MFCDAKIVGINCDDRDYHKKQEVPRGHKDFVMSRGNLIEFANCPSRWFAGYESPGSDAATNGNLMDCLLLTPENFDKRYAVTPETFDWFGMKCPQCGSITDSQKCSKCKCDREKTKQTSLWNWKASECQAWKKSKEDRGLEPLSLKLVSDAHLAVARLRKDELIASWLECCDNCVWIEAVWHDKATGLKIKCKALLDFVPNPEKAGMADFSSSLGDFKTTRAAGSKPWQRWCGIAKYHIQAAFYTDIFNATLKPDERPRETFAFILSENFPPFEPGRRILSQDFMDLGRASYRRMMEDYCKCVASGKWPGYDDVDTAAGGFGIVAPSQWMAMEEQFADHYEFEEPKEQPEAERLNEMEVTP